MAPPPGYTAYTSMGPGQSGPFKGIGGIARALVTLQVLVAVLALAVLALQLGARGAAQDYLDEVITRDEFDDELSTYVAVSGLSGLVTVAALVLLVIWSFRIAGNLQKLGRHPLTWRPGLSIVAWVLGGCTLGIITFLMLREHDRGSDPTVPPGDPSWRNRPVDPAIVVWFVLSLATAVVTIIGGVRTVSGVSVDNTRNLARSLVDRLPLVLASGLLSAASAVVLIFIVRRMTERHRQAIREV